MTLIPDNNINTHQRSVTHTETGKGADAKKDDQKIQFEKLLRERGHGAKDMRSSDFLGNTSTGNSDIALTESSGAQRFDETGVMGNSTEVEYSSNAKSDPEARSPNIDKSQNLSDSVYDRDDKNSLPKSLAVASTVTLDAGRQSQVSKNISHPSRGATLNNIILHAPSAPEILVSSKLGVDGPANSKGDLKIASDANTNLSALKARIAALVKTLKSAQSNPIQIAIIGVESGMKVSVRMPQSETIDRHQLKKQISSLLSEHGYQNVEIEIQGPENGQSREVERHTK